MYLHFGPKEFKTNDATPVPTVFSCVASRNKRGVSHSQLPASTLILARPLRLEEPRGPRASPSGRPATRNARLGHPQASARSCFSQLTAQNPPHSVCRPLGFHLDFAYRKTSEIPLYASGRCVPHSQLAASTPTGRNCARAARAPRPVDGRCLHITAAASTHSLTARPTSARLKLRKSHDFGRLINK